MAINLNDGARGAATQLAHAFRADDEAQIAEGFAALQAAIADDVAEQYKDAVAANDRAILAQRGFRQLTGEETRYYQAILDAMGSANPKQAFATIAEGDNNVPGKMMPETIINEIFKNLTESHPLLSLVNVTNTGFITTWLRNKHTRQLAKWGEVETPITEEVRSAFEVVQVTQGKLSCYLLVHRDMLALGPTWLDGYMRTVLSEAMACGLEAGIVGGKGIAGEPVGLDRKIAEGTSVSTTTGYPRKAKVKVAGFEPAEYGALVARLAKDERGHVKASLDGLTLVCNLNDYLTKVMPATTLRNADGRFVNDLFPIATRVVTSEVIADGEAILFVPREYDLLVGGTRGIEYSDEYRFLEDQRCAKVVTYAFGKAHDENSALLLDISKLDPAYVTVKLAGAAGSGTGD